MPAGALTGPPGWYGKLSVLGDFAHRRLAPELVERFDAWLAAWVAESRRELGERWLDAYLDAPLLRFAWSPGVAGPIWWFGVLMPSCDRAGRYFPLLVAQARAAAPADGAEAERLDCWLDRVADAAAGTLDDAASVEAFEAALAATVADGAGDAGGTARGTVRFAGPGLSHWWVRTVDRPTTLNGLPDAASITRLWLTASRGPPA